MKLTSEALEQFHQEGFLHLPHFASEEMCLAILEKAQWHLTQKIEPIETELGYDRRDRAYRTEVTDYCSHETEPQVTVRRLRQVYQRDPLFQAWIEHQAIRPILQQILAEPVVVTTAHHNSIMTKMPYFSKETRWHQDRRYWQYSNDNLVSVWLALDEESSENGALEFIAGSHRMSFSTEAFDEKAYFVESYPPNQPLIAQKKQMKLSRGDVVIFHSMLLHRANHNATHKPKLSFVYTVKGASTKAIEGSRSAQFQEIPLAWIEE